MLSTRRLIILAVVIGMAIAVATLRAIQVQVFEYPDREQAASAQQIILDPIFAPRGAVFDRNGNLFAVSSRAYLVRVNTETITDTQVVAAALGPVLSKSPEEVRVRLQAIINDSKAVTPTMTNIVAYNLSPEATFQLTMALQTVARGGLAIDNSWARQYPHGQIAGPTLGFVSLQPVGYSGVEGYYNKRLSAEYGGRKERSRMDLLTITPTLTGADVVLTLDMTLQTYVENRLARAMLDYQPTAGTIIVMDTHTGAILASASSPGYDPNLALDMVGTPAEKRLHDPAVSDAYEPGSVLKVPTIAAALQAGVVTTGTIFNDKGELEISGKRIFNSDLGKHGKVDIEDVLRLSLNVVAAQIALDMGPDKFYDRFQAFGFGRKTGIDLLNESEGDFRTPLDPKWSKTDLATHSYGQGMTATPYQVINAINVIANDGVLVQPYVVQQWREADGSIVNKQPVQIQRVISPETAHTMREAMVRATRRGTPKALVKGYTIAGKTGTADWYLRGLKQETTIVTYVGFLPASHPRLTILVKFDQPKSSRWAADSTVPVFHDVAEQAVRILGVSPDE
jgi:cell division protein FtsI/penicillin-binding protein 2